MGKKTTLDIAIILLAVTVVATIFFVARALDRQDRRIEELRNWTRIDEIDRWCNDTGNDLIFQGIERIQTDFEEPLTQEDK